MLSIVWFSMIAVAVLTGIANNTLSEVITAIPVSANKSFSLALSLGGIMAFWLGLTQIAQDAGIIDRIAHRATPILKHLFPDVPKDHPALGHISFNIIANVFGLNNAATPLGIKAMESLETLNKFPGRATNAMCTLLAINTSSVQLVPTTAIALLASAGASDPTVIVASTIIATSFSTITALIAARLLAAKYPD